MVARGFEETASKDDIKAVCEEIADVRSAVATKQELHELEERVWDAINKLTIEIQKLILLTIDVRELEKRVDRLERKAGLLK